MNAFKCDICGKYCDEVYRNNDDTFDIFPNNSNNLGLGNKHIELRDMCHCCYEDIQRYIHNKYLKNY